MEIALGLSLPNFTHITQVLLSAKVTTKQMGERPFASVMSTQKNEDLPDD